MADGKKAQTVREVMRPLDQGVHLHESVHVAAKRLRDLGLPAMPVIDGDKVVGIVDEGALQQALADPKNPAVRDCYRADAPHCLADSGLDEAKTELRVSEATALLVLDSSLHLEGLLLREDVADTKPAATPPPQFKPRNGEREEHPRLKVYDSKPKLER